MIKNSIRKTYTLIISLLCITLICGCGTSTSKQVANSDNNENLESQSQYTNQEAQTQEIESIANQDNIKWEETLKGMVDLPEYAKGYVHKPLLHKEYIVKDIASWQKLDTYNKTNISYCKYEIYEDGQYYLADMTAEGAAAEFEDVASKGEMYAYMLLNSDYAKDCTSWCYTDAKTEQKKCFTGTVNNQCVYAQTVQVYADRSSNMAYAEVFAIYNSNIDGSKRLQLAGKDILYTNVLWMEVPMEKGADGKYKVSKNAIIVGDENGVPRYDDILWQKPVFNSDGTITIVNRQQ